MALSKGIATKKLRDAVDANSAPAAADISDASTIGKTILTAEDAAAVITALSVATSAELAALDARVTALEAE